jgi:FMN reductase
MSFFLSLSGSPTKFSKSGFLLQAVASILEKRNVKLRTVHALDLPGESGRFVADVLKQVRQASAVLLLTRPAKGDSPQLLAGLLELLPADALSKKPVVLVATGGFPGHLIAIEHSLKPTLIRLGATAIAARVHIGTGSWSIRDGDKPRLSRRAEQEITEALDLVLHGLNVRKPAALHPIGSSSGENSGCSFQP